jgi:hypothetical protein
MVRKRSAGSTGSTGSAGSTGSTNSAKKPEAPAPAGLEATVLDLKATLDAVQPKDTVLLKQISDLKADLEAKQSALEAKDNLIAKLQTEAKQADQLKAELADAKQMILKLSEVNAKPLAIPAPPAAAKPEPKPEPKSEPQSAPRSTLKIEPADRKTPHESALRKVLQHPTPPGSLPTMPSEKKEGQISELDIGWMD